MYSQNTTFRMAIESLHLLMSRKHPENCYIIHTYIQYICIFIYSNKTNICVYTTNSIFRAATEWLHVPMSHKYSENCYIIHTYIREYLYIYIPEIDTYIHVRRIPHAGRRRSDYKHNIGWCHASATAIAEWTIWTHEHTHTHTHKHTHTTQTCQK